MGQLASVESLILLVGSNPLPNYLAAMALKPSKIHLVYSPHTEKPKERLRKALIADLGLEVRIDGDSYVEDPFSADSVKAKIRDLMSSPASTQLNYTGGTKVMSAHALKTFYEKGGQPENASYLDESQRCLRFDDGSSRSLSDSGVTLTLDRILQLHDIDPGKQRSRPSAEWIENVAKQEIARKGSAKENAVPQDQETWRLFLEAEWLEEWVRLRLHDLLPNSEIHAGLTCSRGPNKRKFEVDVVLVHSYRTFVVSCTTTHDLSRCKQKAFEVAERSRHLAGDLARSALICYLDGVDNNEKRLFVDLLRDDVNEIWGDPEKHPTTTRIWGLEDIRTWSGHYGSPNLDSLKKWLES